VSVPSYEFLLPNISMVRPQSPEHVDAMMFRDAGDVGDIGVSWVRDLVISWRRSIFVRFAIAIDEMAVPWRWTKDAASFCGQP
jgi:hypothetical protein